MMNVLKRGVHVGAVLVPFIRKPHIHHELKALVNLCGGSTDHVVEGLWYSDRNACFVYDHSTYYDFCMFDTTRIHEFEPLLLKLADKLRELGEQSVMIWVRRDGVLIPHLYEGA